MCHFTSLHQNDKRPLPGFTAVHGEIVSQNDTKLQLLLLFYNTNLIQCKKKTIDVTKGNKFVFLKKDLNK